MFALVRMVSILVQESSRAFWLRPDEKDAGDQRAQAETRWSRRAAEGASWAAGPLAQATPLAADGPASGVLSSPRAVDVAASASGIAAGAVTVPQV